jgi:hypothetical protein
MERIGQAPFESGLNRARSSPISCPEHVTGAYGPPNRRVRRAEPRSSGDLGRFSPRAGFSDSVFAADRAIVRGGGQLGNSRRQARMLCAQR